MRCPICGSVDDKVIDSRQNLTGANIRRRRECLNCSYRFTSYERIEEKHLMVIKRDGRREPFDPEKIRKGLQISLQKRPVSQRTIEEMVHDLEDEAAVMGMSSHEIPAAEVGKKVLTRLYRLDLVGYIRFASVYRMFENVEEFIKEIETIGAEQLSGEQTTVTQNNKNREGGE